MNRNFVLLSAAALLGACASTSTSAGTMEPQTVSTTTSTSITTSTTDTSSMTARRGGRRGMMDPARMEQMMLRDITLSADQKVKLDSLHARHMAEMDQMRARGDTMPMMNRDHMRMMMEQHQAELRAILTPDQQVTFDRNMAEMRARMQQGGRPGGPPRI